MSNEKASNAIVSTVTFYASALAEVTARAVDAEKRAAAAIEQVNAMAQKLSSLHNEASTTRTSAAVAEVLSQLSRLDEHVWNELASIASPYTLQRLIALRRAWDGNEEYGKVESEKHASRQG